MERKQAELQDRFRRALENAEDGEGGCPKRDVTPVWRLCCADSMEQRSSGGSFIFIHTQCTLVTFKWQFGKFKVGLYEVYLQYIAVGSLPVWRSRQEKKNVLTIKNRQPKKSISVKCSLYLEYFLSFTLPSHSPFQWTWKWRGSGAPNSWKCLNLNVYSVLKYWFKMFVSVYQLNLWRPSSDLQSLLKEGCRYKVYNLTTSDGKKHVGSSTVQLTGTKKTQFQDLQVL